jgi:LysR family cyn operon transcriptional activator
MELRHLRYFVAVAGSLSFTRAAERVHVTQSTLSHQIRQLEQELGRDLFDRLGKRVVLTEAGESFLLCAQRALMEIDQGVAQLKSAMAPLTGVVRVGTTHTFNVSLLPDCVGEFLERNPTVQVIVDERAADAITAGLVDGSLDFGIGYKPEWPEGLRFEPLFNEELVLVVGHDHPLARRRKVRMIELHQQPLVLLPASFSTRRLLDDCFAAAGAAPHVVAEMNTVAAMLRLAHRVGAGTILATNAVRDATHMRQVKLESPTPIRTPGLLFKEGAVASAASRAFISLLRLRSTPRPSRRAAATASA